MSSNASESGTGAGGGSATGEPELVVVEPVVTAVVRGVVPTARLRGFFDSSFRALGESLARQQVAVLSPAFGLYHAPPGETADLEVGFVTDRAVRAEGDVAVGALPAARVARLVHHGSFDGLGASWERLQSFVHEQGLKPGPLMWEVYVTKPSPEMDPGDLRTELNCVIAD